MGWDIPPQLWRTSLSMEVKQHHIDEYQFQKSGLGDSILPCEISTEAERHCSYKIIPHGVTIGNFYIF